LVSNIEVHLQTRIIKLFLIQDKRKTNSSAWPTDTWPVRQPTRAQRAHAIQLARRPMTSAAQGGGAHTPPGVLQKHPLVNRALPLCYAPIPRDCLYANKPSVFLSFTMAWSPVTPTRAGAAAGSIGAPAGHPRPPKALTRDRYSPMGPRALQGGG
jgi:hypothetical protein